MKYQTKTINPFYLLFLLVFMGCIRGGCGGGSLHDVPRHPPPGIMEKINDFQFEYTNNDRSYLKSQISPKPDYRFDIIDDIQYADYDEKFKNLLRLDLYKPLKGGKRPLIVFVHSGGFITGSKDGYVATKYCNDLAGKGYVVASVDYRLIKSIKYLEDAKSFITGENVIRSKIYDSLTDIKTAIRFLIANSEQYNIDKDNIFLGGYSAGAIAALHLVYSDYTEIKKYVGKGAEVRGDFNLKAFVGQDYSEDIDFTFNGVFALAGGMLKPNHIDGSDNVPTLLIHAEDDDMVPYVQGRPFSKFVKDYKLGIPGLYHELGITRELSDGTSEKITIGGVDISLRVSEDFVSLFREIFTSDIYGSKTVFDRCQGNCELITIKQGRHVFMRNLDNDFNQTYYDTRKAILDFLNRNTK